METDDPILLEALREVDRIAPAAPNVAPPLEPDEPDEPELTNLPGRLVTVTAWEPAPPCLVTDLVDEVDCPHCMEQRGLRIKMRIARSNGWS